MAAVEAALGAARAAGRPILVSYVMGGIRDDWVDLLAAMIDAHLFHGNALNLDPAQITWPRAMDMNDRALRRVTVGVGAKGDGANREAGFVITAASEIMAARALRVRWSPSGTLRT